jgi:unsaturated rhamnogalacturonyl hydrolase
MAKSVLKHHPEAWMVDFKNKPRWGYMQGLILKAILQVWQTHGNKALKEYAYKYYDRFVREDGTIETYDLEEYNIDRINAGKPLFHLYKETGNDKYKKAIFLLRKQMKTHPRTKVGGFWHKKIYPYQMWLDGLYMASPFLAQFAGTFNELEMFDDIAQQYILMEKYARDEKTGLLYHGWDESRLQRWADPKTGLSPHFWGRGMGWYAMALVDVLDFLPKEHPEYNDIIAILKRLCTAVTKFQDDKTGLWYQVVDQDTREGNYLEASASCMFVYSLLKGVRKGYIDSSYIAAARKGYNGILTQLIEVDDDGLVNIHQGCASAGLGGNPYRDGSYAYYINEKIRSNDPKSVGPFILASLEFESMNEKLATYSLNQGKLIYKNKLNSNKSVKDWIMEGPGELKFKSGWMEMWSPDEKGHHVFWCPRNFPDRFIAEWKARNIETDAGLCIIFFAAKGEKGEDIFDSTLPQRDGTFKQYTQGKIVSYHISYYANAAHRPDRGDSHLRKNNTFSLVQTGEIGIPTKSKDIHKMKLVKDGSHIIMYVDNRKIIDWIDNGTDYGPVHTDGKIGFRQMRWTHFSYRNFKVWELK